MKRKRIADGVYELHDDRGIAVARASKSGTHLDDYPWSWSLIRPYKFPGNVVRETGTEDTLKACIDVISSSIKQYGLVVGSMQPWSKPQPTTAVAPSGGTG